MTAATFVAGDWGTTHGRFWLCDGIGQSLDARTLPGIEKMKNRPWEIADAFDAALKGWPEELPVIMAGMVGANIGWRDAGYVECPFGTRNIGGSMVRFMHGKRPVSILPGLKCRNGFGALDVMRGEETQLVGAILCEHISDAVLALPGTHNKWAIVAGGQITGFHTVLTGEIFDVLSRYSILLPSQNLDVGPGAAFDEGVALVRGNPQTGLETFLFSVRARQITEKYAASDAACFMSGLLIGCDIRSAAALVGETTLASPVYIICNEKLAKLYDRAMTGFGIKSRNLSGSDAVLAGLFAAWKNGAQ